MSEFETNGYQMGRQSATMKSYPAKINYARNTLTSVSQSLAIRGESQLILKRHMAGLSENLRSLAAKTGMYADILDQARTRYDRTEKQICAYRMGTPSFPDSSDHSGQNLEWLDHVEDFSLEELSDLLTWYAPAFMPLIPGSSAIPVADIIWKIVKQIKRNQDYLNQITDPTTRNYLEQYPDYLSRISNAYENASGKAKDVFTALLPGLVVSTMNYPGTTSYDHVNDRFNLKASEVNDPRGPEKIFYHESGHYVVDQNNWVYTDENGVRQESTSFKAFHDAVDREAKAYINQTESAVRTRIENKYNGKLTQAQIDQLVHTETIKQMKKDIGGTHHSTNAVQDIISGASQDDWRIGYGHSKTYWQADPTRQGNEAFAQFFTIDINSSSAELAFIQKYMPDAWAAYQNLLDEAL